MFPSLGSKSEEDKEDERANDARPLREGQTDHCDVVSSPKDGRDLPDTAEIVMSFFPTDPGRDRGGGRVDDDRENCQWSSAHNFHASQGHQTEISAGSER